jgi:hypothetical protein
MTIRDKALYNLLRINWLEDPSIEVQSWQIEDYREIPIGVLFERLRKLGISLTQDSFLKYSENYDTPEELTDFLWIKDEDAQEYDQAYLILFELWRRLLPEKQSLSIFCNELDHRIYLYDKKILPDEELIQDALGDLEDILDQSVDDGEAPGRVFKSIAEHYAHDLENFIYDYISDQIDAGNEVYASELLDAFYEYIDDQKWFDFLRARLFASTDFEDANSMLRRLLELLQESPDLDLLMEIVSFLVHTGDPQLFLDSAAQAVQLIKTEGDFQDLIGLAADYYRLLDNEEDCQFLQKVLKQRSQKDCAASLQPSDKGLAAFAEFLKSKIAKESLAE